MSDEQKPMLTDGQFSQQERYINPYTDFGFKKLFGTEASIKNYWDYNSTMKTAADKAKAEGRAEGLAEGLAEGRAEGRAEEKLANARSLKENGVPVDVIAKSLGLTAEEIGAL